MSEANALKTFFRHYPKTARSLVAVLILLALLVLLRVLLSPLIIMAAESWLHDQGLEASIEDVRIDITGGTFAIDQATARENGKPLFTVGLVEVHWQWAPLSEKTIEVTRVVLQQLKVDIKQYSDLIVVGGVRIPLADDAGKAADISADEASEKAAKQLAQPWAAALGEIDFDQLQVCYLQHQATLAQSNADSLLLDYCINIDELSWQGEISYATKKKLLAQHKLPLASTGDFELNGLRVHDNRLGRNLLVSRANQLQQVVIEGLDNIRISAIDMQSLSLLQRDDALHKDAVRFSRLLISDLDFKQMHRLSIGPIHITEPGMYIVKHGEDDWEYQQWLPTPLAQKSHAAQQQDDATTGSVTEQTAFKLQLAGIHIEQADNCFQDNSRKLYYCLTFAVLDWDGRLSLDADRGQAPLQIAGKLQLDQMNIRNQTLQRDLLALNNLRLQQLNLDGHEQLALARVQIDKLRALQRSRNDDEHSLTFASLDITSIDYQPQKLVIDTVSLDQLQLLLAKTRDGHWDFDPWLPSDKTSTAGKTGATPAATGDKTASTPANKPVFRLNRFTLNSEQPISFVDNTTKPAMHVGLQKLDIQIDELYSDQPDHDSRIQLDARTSRHGTITLAGTARPFADKISFDAKGQLKGFDLRAATPATKKAIGHIIQSGQMNADLKLYAKDGILDSNIALSLYQFHIKAMSKKDAEKLDKQFGMPLNRTLVLLRDKDGSIHLDIPITGDVNNPDFDPMDAIVTATSKAAAVTLITFYTPYGLAYVGGNILFDLATALNFDPVVFDSGSSELSAAGREQLDKLAILLTEKPHVHLTLCGATNTADSEVLFPPAKPTEGDKPAGVVALNDKQLKALEQLARQRQINSKNYLVNEKAIDHDRLILCAPEHSSDKDAIAGVSIEI